MFAFTDVLQALSCQVSCASNALLGLHQYLQGFVHSALMTFALYPLTHAQPWMLPLCYMALRPCVSASKANQHLDIYSGSMLSLPNVTPRDMWYGTLALVETKGLLMHYGHDTWHENFNRGIKGKLRGTLWRGVEGSPPGSGSGGKFEKTFEGLEECCRRKRKED
ncbi:hypothetical protein CK203_039572 [Vitis vinifera]|uniref:Uncharacterized protein n=1 Tax=Vitis vinifera TaxID=29760 RepID=A0A438HG36_VITVI|nr:hypothetical protein CK203_039572 [Vitis vinifera]